LTLAIALFRQLISLKLKYSHSSLEKCPERFED